MSKFDYTINYRRWHENTPEYFAAQAPMFRKLLGDIVSRFPKDAQLLDYGCGYGLLSYFLKQEFQNVLSVDSSPQQIAVAKSMGLDAQIVATEAFESWAASNAGSFDAIFLFDVLEHIPVNLQIAFLLTLSSTLKLGGQILVKVPNANSLMAARWRYIDWTHTSSFTEASLDFVCLSAGLTQPEYLTDDSSLRPRLRWFPRPSVARYYLRVLLRSLWKLYLYAELGSQTKKITVGYNLLARASRLR
jgi:cyclopropane fatty-acyl-phospholipid synthase-like methyltransferase